MKSDDIAYLETTIPSLHGWCSLAKAKQMYELVLACDHDRGPVCVELGVFAGRSLLAIALGARATNGKAFGIDAWSKDASAQGVNDTANTEWWNNIDYEFFYSYTQNVLKDAKVDEHTTLIRDTSTVQHVVDQFADESISMLHQDSNHSEAITIAEVNLWCNKVKIGGHWVFDDTDWPTTELAQDLLLQKGYELVFTEQEGKHKVYRRI